MFKLITDLVKGDFVLDGIDVYRVEEVRVAKYGAFVYGQKHNRKNSRYGRSQLIYNLDGMIKVFGKRQDADNYIIARIKELTKYLPFFVYGTLRPGQHNYFAFFNGKTIKEMSGTTSGVMYAKGIPYLFEGDEVVHGDVLWVSEKQYQNTLENVDTLEGFSPFDNWSHYERKEITVRLSNGAQVQAWAYYCSASINTSGLRKVPNNDYNELYPIV